ncbi:MAG: hypothetical protein PUP92_15915 [Rhizonema sp. PD38]|nr:hypothetical protein [Rhizonema sp. PD38]
MSLYAAFGKKRIHDAAAFFVLQIDSADRCRAAVLVESVALVAVSKGNAIAPNPFEQYNQAGYTR